MNARKAASSAQQRGTLTPKPCEVCGSLDVEKHHEDYDQPLEVRWLCRKHHVEITQGARQMAPTELPDPDLDRSTWFTKQEAAARLHVTTKTVERFAQEGKITQARWRRPTGGPMLVVYHPQDVAQLLKARPPGSVAGYLGPGPDVSTNGNGNGSRELQALEVTSSASATPLPTAEELIRGLAALVQRMSQTSRDVSDTMSQTPTLWVTVKDAAAILGFPQADVRRMIHEGDLDSRQTGRGGIRIRRTDLEQL
jgi:excisionase family DNA binding protein